MPLIGKYCDVKTLNLSHFRCSEAASKLPDPPEDAPRLPTEEGPEGALHRPGRGQEAAAEEQVCAKINIRIFPRTPASPAQKRWETFYYYFFKIVGRKGLLVSFLNIRWYFMLGFSAISLEDLAWKH